MGGLFYIAGIALAGYAGYVGGAWFVIFVASFLMTIGYFIIRAPQIHAITAGQGVLAPFKLWLIQTVLYSVITAPVFFIGTLIQ